MDSTAVNIPQTSHSAPVKAAVICLILAWVFALLPIPIVSMGGMIVFNIMAFIFAIICMSRSAVVGGGLVLAGSILGTPIMYFLGIGIVGLLFIGGKPKLEQPLASPLVAVPTAPAPIVGETTPQQISTPTKADAGNIASHNAADSVIAPASSETAVWNGKYTCLQGKTGLTLLTNHTGAGKVKALFYFYPTDSNPAAPAGCFSMEGNTSESGKVVLHGKKWLQQPMGYQMVKVNGQMTDGGFSGAIQNPACSTFTTQKESSPALPIPAACNNWK